LLEQRKFFVGVSAAKQHVSAHLRIADAVAVDAEPIVVRARSRRALACSVTTPLPKQRRAF
jgi:hypothetical protein